MDFVSISVTTHVYAIIILLFVMVYNLFNVLKTKEFIPLAQKLRFMTPIYHTINAIVAYTGGTVAAFSHDLSITVILMIATTIFVMVLEIKRYKKMRVIKSNDYEKQEEFRQFARKIYMVEIAALVLTYVVAKVF